MPRCQVNNLPASCCVQPDPPQPQPPPSPQGSPAEYPLSFSPSSSHRTAAAPDGRFGSALACNASLQSFAALRPAVDYAKHGSFAINVWIKPGSQLDGGGGGGGGGDLPGGIAYVLSHAPPGGAGGAPGANSIGLMLPRPGHPRFGVVRGVLRDGNDAAGGSGAASSTGQPEDGAWLDSDGSVGQVGSDDATGAAADAMPGGPAGVVPDTLDLYDREW